MSKDMKGPQLPDMDRFWSKVQKGDDCWTWQAYRNALGYGIFAVGRKPQLAHRISYRIHHGLDPGRLKVCHRCDNPPCVRPEHLFLGTIATNTADMIAKGRKPKFCGMKNGRAKLNLVQVQEIRTRYIPGQIRIVDLASEYCVSKSQIWNIVTKAQWNDFPSALS